MDGKSTPKEFPCFSLSLKNKIAQVTIKIFLDKICKALYEEGVAYSSHKAFLMLLFIA